MKTLILNGSPRPDGDTARLLSRLREQLTGEVMQVNVYDGTVGACRDCRYCRTHRGCCLRDGMQDIYPYLEDCDTVVLASPIYFSELTGPLLSLLSRLQPYYCARVFRGEPTGLRPKRGALLLCGGGDGSMDTAVRTATVLLHQMNAADLLPPVLMHGTDAGSNAQSALDQVDKLARLLKQ